MPRTQGDGIIHIDDIDFKVEYNEAIPEIDDPILTPTQEDIRKHIAGLIEDGSNLQMGIGAIPNAVLSFLSNHKNLGIHSEMFSNGLIPLIEKGIVNGSLKHSHPGKVVSSFVIGNRELYDFLDENPEIAMLDYAVELTENSCVDTSTCVSIRTLNIENISLSDHISVFPNPTQGILSIEFNEPVGSISLRLLSISGQVIRH